MEHASHGTPDGGARLFGEGVGSAGQLWDEKYRGKERIWSGNPNPQLVAEASGLVPGAAGPGPVPATALDLGCGEGADAIWLARHGWAVTAVDVSAVALERAAGHAAETGVQYRISWQQRDLAAWQPAERFGLVSAQFLHSPLLPWRDSAATAAAAVAPGGTLLIVGHHPHGLAPWSGHAGSDMFFTPEELAEELGLDRGPWTVHVLASRERTVPGPDGRQATILDTVLRATRNR